MGNVTVASLNYHETRDEAKNDFLGTLSSSYATGGDTLTAKQCGLSFFNSIIIATKSGYIFQPIISTDKQTALIKAYTAGEGGYTPAGTNANESSHTHAVVLDTGTSAAGTAHTHTFTGSSSALNLATPVFSGTGYATAGQVITTTGNHTMALNACAGMWFIADALSSTAPALIISNTAVTGAPAVLTVIGAAPATDAGTYKIVAVTPSGTNANESAHTHGPGTLADAASGAGSAHTHIFTGTAAATSGADEVANGTNLTVTPGAIYMMAFGG